MKRILRRRSVAFSGVFLVVVGSLGLVFGVWYVFTYGMSTDFSVRDVLFPEYSGNLLWLMSVSLSMIVLGIIFLLWAHRLRNDSTL